MRRVESGLTERTIQDRTVGSAQNVSFLSRGTISIMKKMLTLSGITKFVLIALQEWLLTQEKTAI